MEFEEKEGEISTSSENKSINSTIHKITVVDPYNFKISNTLKYSKYIRNGVSKQVSSFILNFFQIKPPKELKFKTIAEGFKEENLKGIIDDNMSIMDFSKLEQILPSHLCFCVLDELQKENKSSFPCNSDSFH
jgi:hypothetical protein